MIKGIKLYLTHDALKVFHAINLKPSYRIFVKWIVLKDVSGLTIGLKG